MTVDILVLASLVYTGRDVIEDGFVYIKGGRVEDVGPSPVPEDYTYATLVIGGEGRIATPGLAVYLDAPAYPIRGLRPGLGDRARFYAGLGAEAARLASLPAVYEAHMAGATTLIVEAPSPSLAVDLSDAVGGFYGAAVPSCLESPASHAAPVVRVSGEGCEGPGEATVEGGKVAIRGREVLALIGRPNYSRLSGEPYRLSQALREALGLPGGRIEKGARAEVVVFNAAAPPGMLLDLYKPPLDEVYTAGLRVESLIAGQEVLVDAGEHLRVTTAHFKEARRLAERLLGRGGR